MQKVGIITCSGGCIPQSFVEEYAIEVIPLTLIVNENVYRDGLDISKDEVYSALKRDFSSVSTSAPSVGEYAQAYRKMLERFSKVLCITMSKELSLSFSSAVKAAEMEKSAQVEVLDSETATTGQGLVAMHAARVAKEGADLPEVRKEAENVSQKVMVLGVLDTLSYLKKSGRAKSISALTAEMLNIKPVLIVEHGDVHLFAKTISRQRGFERVMKSIREYYEKNGPIHLGVFHAMAREEADKLEERIRKEVECIDPFMGEFTPVLGKHTGPGIVGASFY
ncbi:MAG: DegV family protein [Actinomycetota bacterium]|nr:DegV family protein [Actinomycetota bacterium]